MSEKILWICPECKEPQYELGRCIDCDFADLSHATDSKDRLARADTYQRTRKTWLINLGFWGGILILVWAIVDGGYARYFKSNSTPVVSEATSTPTPTPRSLTDEEFQAFTAMNKYAEEQFAGWKLEGSTLDVTDADAYDSMVIHMNFSKGNENKTVAVILEKFNAHLDQPAYWKAFTSSPEFIQPKTPEP